MATKQQMEKLKYELDIERKVNERLTMMMGKVNLQKATVQKTSPVVKAKRKALDDGILDVASYSNMNKTFKGTGFNVFFKGSREKAYRVYLNQSQVQRLNKEAKVNVRDYSERAVKLSIPSKNGGCFTKFVPKSN